MAEDQPVSSGKKGVSARYMKKPVGQNAVAPPSPRLDLLAHAPLPTREGVFDFYVFRGGNGNAPTAVGLSDEHLALVMGDVRGKTQRARSACIPSA